MGIFRKEKFDTLIDGELPWGWDVHHRKFTNSIVTKHKYFMSLWLDSRNENPNNQYLGLNSFVTFLQETQSICQTNGECYFKWFTDTIADSYYINQRQSELSDLKSNITELEDIYNKHSQSLESLDDKLFQFIHSHNGILQKDIYKEFDSLVKADIQELLYYWEKSEKIRREKSGNTYKVFIR